MKRSEMWSDLAAGQQRRGFDVAPSKMRVNALWARSGLRCCYALHRIRDAEPRLFGSTCDKSATAGAGQWPRIAASGVGGHAVKKRLALAFVALGLTPAAAPAGDLDVAPLYLPVPFVPRQTVECTGITLVVNAGYGWGQTSTNTSFEGDRGRVPNLEFLAQMVSFQAYLPPRRGSAQPS